MNNEQEINLNTLIFFYKLQYVNVRIFSYTNVCEICNKILYFIRDWSSNGVLVVDTEDYEIKSSNLNDYSDIFFDQKNIAFDWHFPIDLYEENRWLLFENDFSIDESNISEFCYIFKNKLLCDFQTEIFLQYPLVVQVFKKYKFLCFYLNLL